MFRNPRFLAAGVLLVAVAVAARAAEGDDKGNKALDEKVYNTLKAVINEGAALYNQGDATGSYRVFQGALMAVGPMLEHRPELGKVIEGGLAKAKEAPSCRHRAHQLRLVLDKVRSEVNPVKLPPPTPGQDKLIEGGGKDKLIEKGKDKLIEEGKDKLIEKGTGTDKAIEKKDDKAIEKKKDD